MTAITETSDEYVDHCHTSIERICIELLKQKKTPRYMALGASRMYRSISTERKMCHLVCELFGPILFDAPGQPYAPASAAPLVS